MRSPSRKRRMFSPETTRLEGREVVSSLLFGLSGSGNAAEGDVVSASQAASNAAPMAQSAAKTDAFLRSLDSKSSVENLVTRSPLPVMFGAKPPATAAVGQSSSAAVLLSTLVVPWDSGLSLGMSTEGQSTVGKPAMQGNAAPPPTMSAGVAAQPRTYFIGTPPTGAPSSSNGSA